MVPHGTVLDPRRYFRAAKRQTLARSSLAFAMVRLA